MIEKNGITKFRYFTLIIFNSCYCNVHFPINIKH